MEHGDDTYTDVFVKSKVDNSESESYVMDEGRSDSHREEFPCFRPTHEAAGDDRWRCLAFIEDAPESEV